MEKDKEIDSEIYKIRIENEKLRNIISKIADNIGNGSACSPECSLEFMELVAEEMRVVIVELRDQVVSLENKVKDKSLEEKDKLACSWIIGQEYPDSKNHPIKLDKVFRPDHPPRYAVRKGERFCLTKEGHWEYESMPSSRTDEFLKIARYDSFEEAMAAFHKFGVAGISIDEKEKRAV